MEIWTYDSVGLPVVHVYKYLGVFVLFVFSMKQSFTVSCYGLTSKAKNAVLRTMHKLQMLNNDSGGGAG